ncbi:MAG: hypothetical protein MUC87_04330 [Bacteroidia bacterium]|jgi:hypothetical protein|nr:hypothetical protein [Bacteroidia bacterium]
MRNSLYTLFLLLAPAALILNSCSQPPGKQEPQNQRVVELHNAALQLRTAGILNVKSDAALDSLEKLSLGADSLNALQELLVRAGAMLEMKLGGDTLMNAAQLYAPEYAKIAARWPDLKAENVSGEFLPSEPGDKDTAYALARFTAGGITYERRHDWMKDDVTDLLLYRTFNKLLADRADSTRLFMVPYLCRNCQKQIDQREIQMDVRRFGLLRLTRSQAKAAMAVSDLMLDELDEFDVYSTAKIAETLSRFASTGLLTAADSAWWREARAAVNQTTIYSQENLYDEFSRFFAIADFRSLNDYYPYGDVLLNLASVSGNLLDPSKMADEQASPSTHVVRYSIGNQLYEKAYQQYDSIWSPELINDINTALSEQKKGASFYTVLHKQGTLQLVLVPDAVAEKAKNSGFFTLFERGAAPALLQEYKAAAEKANAQNTQPK